MISLGDTDRTGWHGHVPSESKETPDSVQSVQRTI